MDYTDKIRGKGENGSLVKRFIIWERGRGVNSPKKKKGEGERKGK